MVPMVHKCHFYFYQWLEQGLFVQLAVTVVATVARLGRELRQWHKYLLLLYSAAVQKLRAVCATDAWMRQAGLPEPDSLRAIPAASLAPPDRPQSAPPRTAHQRPARPQTLRRPATPGPGTRTPRDEIDDIFSGL